ncbi:hypothetical protein [Agromyces sp. LHK192]|uniref:hypothetical protein n=1 Tax=Agromyces sp. LHK192 TaxID=2498704 RepID=UPI000FD6DE76|nr:hypothetical protein [Agromyces sp. LHK192]
MTAITATVADAEATTSRFRAHDLWRIIRLQAVNPYVFFGVPWLILGTAWLISIIIGLIIVGAGGPQEEMAKGMRYSWAVLSPQWYLVVVGVQAITYTFPFALGFGATRRDYWLGTSLMFLLVSAEMAVAIATLVQLEQLTNGWWIGISMFDALWYGQQGWLFDFYSTFALQLLVLFIGAAVATIYMRWRMKGSLSFFIGLAALLLGAIALFSFTETWPAVFQWFGAIGLTGTFTLVLGIAAGFALTGYLVIRRATVR